MTAAPLLLDTGVDTAGFLANLLTGYEPASILREQAQNADDACHTQGLSDGWLRIEIGDAALVVENPSLLSDDDWRRLARTASRGKADDADQTGEFGVGFWSVLHLTDVPVITSGEHRAKIDQLSGRRAKREQLVEHHLGTKFEFPLRLSESETGRRLAVPPVTTDILDELESRFEEQLPELLLFTRALQQIELRLRDGSVIQARRTITLVDPKVSIVTVTVTGGRRPTSGRFFRVDGSAANPPDNRDPHVSVAFPLDGGETFAGRVFCTFPTDTPTGLRCSINGHFFPAQDRRTIRNEGAEGRWNTTIFAVAGILVGRALTVVLDTSGKELESRLAWFLPGGETVAEVASRRKQFLQYLDIEALGLALLADRQGVRRAGSELRLLASQIDGLLGPHYPKSVSRPEDERLLGLYQRWGVQEESVQGVARWLAASTPAPGTPIAGAPAFMNEVRKLRTLLQYCAPAAGELAGARLTLATDGRLHPIGAPGVPRPSRALLRFTVGLRAPIVAPDLQDTVAWKLAPEAGLSWFRDALVAQSPQAVGKKLGKSKVFVYQSIKELREVVEVFTTARQSLLGLPLALDPSGVIRVFDATTIVGLPPVPHWEAAERLLTRLGRSVLHPGLDAGLATESVEHLTHQVLLDLVTAAATSGSWDPVLDGLDLLDLVAALVDGRRVRREDLQSLAAIPIWPAQDGSLHPLADMYLPDPNRAPRRSERRRVLDTRLCDATAAGRLGLRVVRDVFDRVVLDPLAETVEVLSKLTARFDHEELAGLLDDLVEGARRLMPWQKDKLRAATFVPCSDGQLRAPAQVICPVRPLPLVLGARSLPDGLREDFRLVELLVDLGARRNPLMADLVTLARAIRDEPVSEHDDPAHALLAFLEFADEYRSQDLHPLSEIGWMPAHPSRQRRPPNELVVPSLSFAAPRFEYPAGERDPSSRVREGLRIRGSLDAKELAVLVADAANEGRKASDALLNRLNQRAASDADARKLSALKDLAFLKVDQQLRRPSELVSPERGRVWSHLKVPVEQDFLNRYPNLARIWGIADERPIGWLEYADVLDALARQPERSEEDRRLARRCLQTLAKEWKAGDLTVDSLRNRRCLPTTSGAIELPEAVLRADLPKAIVDQVSGLLPIAVDHPSEVADLLSALEVPSLRAALLLTPVYTGAINEPHWQERLGRHRANLLRFLRHAGAALPDEWVDRWPPAVECVDTLRLRASREGTLLSEWDERCFLYGRAGQLVLLIQGQEAGTRAIVDAIAILYGIKAGRKSLLVQVLDSATTEEGADCLEYDSIPDLAEDDPWAAVEPLRVDLEHVEDDPSAAEAQEAPMQSAGAPAGGAPSSSTAAPNGEVTLKQPERPAPAPIGPPVPAAPVAPKVRTDWEALTQKKYKVIDVEGDPVVEDDLGAPDRAKGEVRRRRCVLSFHDCVHGLLPLRSHEANALVGPEGISSVHLFGQEYPAHQADERTVRIEGGAELYTQFEIVPGTVVNLRPGRPGRLELHIEESPHTVDDVWILEIDEDGRLRRERIASVNVRWETDGPLYRCERRWEDLEALHAEATASALDLIIRAFGDFGADGLTTQEVWSAVALHRLFAFATIRTELSRQDGLFSQVADRWFKSGDSVKRFSGQGVNARPPGPARSTHSAPRTAAGPAPARPSSAPRTAAGPAPARPSSAPRTAAGPAPARPSSAPRPDAGAGTPPDDRELILRLARQLSELLQQNPGIRQQVLAMLASDDSSDHSRAPAFADSRSSESSAPTDQHAARAVSPQPASQRALAADNSRAGWHYNVRLSCWYCDAHSASPCSRCAETTSSGME